MGITLHTGMRDISFLFCWIGNAIAELVMLHISVEAQVLFWAISVGPVAYKVALNSFS
jgi:hypothetical protein